MSAAWRAGVWYFLVVFALGFVLGTLRVLILRPAMGEAAALALEIPVMLLISWGAAGWLIARHEVRARMGARVAMGGVAFGLLMLAEVGVGTLGIGFSLDEHFGKYATIAGLVGLAGQAVFGLIPILRLRVAR